MPTNWDAAYTKCPFYVSENKLSISCEGLISSKSAVHLFNRQKEKQNHKYKFCNNAKSYKYCSYYYILMKTKYKEQED